MKNFFGSMAGRVFLLLLAGVIASVALTLALASRERQEEISRVRNNHAVDRVEQLVVALEAASPEGRSVIAAAARSAGIRADFTATAAGLGETDSEFTQALRERLGRDNGIAATRMRGEGCFFRERPGNGANLLRGPGF